MSAQFEKSPFQLFFIEKNAYKLSENENYTIDAQLENLPFENFIRIFSDNQKSSQEEALDESAVYCINPNQIENTNKESQNSPLFIKRNIFSLSTSGNSSEKIIKKKRGRKAKKETLKIHDKSSPDNLLRKIQVHYFTFIIDYLNEVLRQLGFNEKFIPIDYQYKKKITKIFFRKLKGVKLADILCENISPKFHLHDAKTNQTLYYKFKANGIFNYLFEQNFFTFFKDMYYKSVYNINLQNYGPLTLLKENVKMFDDLLKKNSNGLNKSYAEKLKLCAVEYYLKDN